MRVLIQGVSGASVSIGGEVHGKIGRGLLLLAGFGDMDGKEVCARMAAKCAGLRIFPDEGGAMNLSLLDMGGEVLAVPNFTLYADCRKGRRPSFVGALAPEKAVPLYEQFAQELKAAGISRVETGVFGADMQVELINDGPVTIWLDSETLLPKTK